MDIVEIKKKVKPLLSPAVLMTVANDTVKDCKEKGYPIDKVEKIGLELLSLESAEGYFVSYLISNEIDSIAIREQVLRQIWRIHRGDLRILMITLEAIRTGDSAKILDELSTLRTLFYCSQNDGCVGYVYMIACSYLRGYAEAISDEKWGYMLTDIKDMIRTSRCSEFSNCFDNYILLRVRRLRNGKRA